MKLDILAFGVHPDDVELGCAGTILSSIAQGKKVGVIDLTRGELGTRGTAETRNAESAAAAKAMGLHLRDNLDMADGFFEHNRENILKIVRVLRQYRPEVILCNAPEDRHPDHGRSSKLVSDAAFLSGLRKIETTLDGAAQEAWRPKYVFQYIQDRYIEPDFVFDISDFHVKKMEAIQCYATQFYNPELDEPKTYISSPDFLESVSSRAKIFGKRIGVKYAEGFLSEKMIGINSFDAIIQHTT
ncbi:MAG TPA: bacillithiol biosynthesis deacetylase BshB1 [Chitinophagaceae bacterium]